MKSKYIDLRVEDVPGDGDCLYHSFIRNNNIHGLPDGPKKLRRQLVEYLESNPNTPDGVSYKDFLCLPLDRSFFSTPSNVEKVLYYKYESFQETIYMYALFIEYQKQTYSNITFVVCFIFK